MSVVVVHRGARDSYEVARALAETGQLETLVTDFYWRPEDKTALQGLMPSRLTSALQRRSNPGLASGSVSAKFLSGAMSAILEKLPVPFAWKRSSIRWTDDNLGRAAGEIAMRRNSALLSYSYYAHSAFRACRGNQPRMLFQLHPHPASMREILRKELSEHPECAASLCREWELSLPEEDFRRLCNEPLLADRCIVASTFTRDTLTSHGVDPDRIDVVPYGVDLARFRPGQERERDSSSPLKLLFVGTINQRKGIRYLVDALQMLSSRNVELRVCGRVVDDLSVFDPVRSQVRITPSVSSAELVEAYQSSDLFVFPSVAEGFGHVLIESLACGLPFLTTGRTAGPDLTADGDAGFLVRPCDAEALAARIDWCVTNRAEVIAMRRRARLTAERFNWERFRAGIVQSVQKCLEPDVLRQEVRPARV